jgi:hypothetical protein
MANPIAHLLFMENFIAPLLEAILSLDGERGNQVLLDG